ncbi:MAG: hypothetical protein EZS28_044669, partial [Streblomastix strix]
PRRARLSSKGAAGVVYLLLVSPCVVKAAELVLRVALPPEPAYSTYLKGNLTETVIDTVSGLVLALRQAERANMARIRLFLVSTPIYLMGTTTP